MAEHEESELEKQDLKIYPVIFDEHGNKIFPSGVMADVRDYVAEIAPDGKWYWVLKTKDLEQEADDWAG